MGEPTEFVLVPREPTEKMVAAAELKMPQLGRLQIRFLFETMMAASPTPDPTGFNAGVEAKLLPCPFCNGADLNQFSHWTSRDDGMVEIKKVQCLSCYAENSIGGWNTRTTPNPSAIRTAPATSAPAGDEAENAAVDLLSEWDVFCRKCPNPENERKAEDATALRVKLGREIRRAAAALERADSRLAELREQLHYANGTADLAMKHRDAAEARVAELEKALEPFANDRPPSPSAGKGGTVTGNHRSEQC